MSSRYLVDLEGKKQNITAEVVNGHIWFKIDEHVFSYALSDLRSSGVKSGKGSAKSPDKIIAPMPGKITKLFVSEGQMVNRGDALLVMEAMKMEYTLKSDATSKVEKLLAKVSDQVTLGQLLVKLKLTET